MTPRVLQHLVPIRSALTLLLSLSLAAGGALAQAPAALPAGLSAVTSVEGIEELRLANGLQVLLVPDDSKPTTTVNVTYRVGSRHENYGETGMAHLLEHMVFKGTPTTQDVWAEFSRRGFRPNGTTSYDRTNYFASFAASDENLRWYLAWQADIMVNSLIRRADLDTEMTVVRNEFESGENNPGRVLQQQVLAAMYRWHNYGKSTIGARTDIENVDIPRLQAFYRTYYQPDNATLIVSGKFERAKVLAWVAESFGPIPRPARALPAHYTLDPPQDGERVVHVRRVGGTPLVFATYHGPAGSHPDAAALQLLALVLGDTPGGRLHKRLVETQLAAQAFAAKWTLAEPSPFFVGFAAAPGQDVAKARAAMAAVVDGLPQEPVTAEELERARVAWLNGWDLGFTDPERIGVALSEAVALGDWRLYFLQRDRVRQVSLADVNRVAREWLRRDNRTVGIYEPTPVPERAPQAARVDVAAAVQGYKGDPAVASVETFDPSPANVDARTQRTRLASGLKVALLPKGARGRVVQARLTLRYGDAKTLMGQETVGGFVAQLIEKGGAGLTRQQIADRFDQLQAEVGFSASDQSLNVSITTKRERLPAVIELVGRLLREPAFPAEPLEEARRQWLTGIERQRAEPGAIIANRLARHGNPYPRGDLRHAASFDEQVEDVKAVTREQVHAFHRRCVSAASGEFTAVGDLDAAAVRQALDKALGDWRLPAGGAQPYVRVPQPLVAVPPARFVERTPDKKNATLRGELALALNDRHADHPALFLANYMFGYGGNSRLWKRVREAEGLSYSVDAWISWASIDANSTWQVTAIFAPENQARVEAAIKAELERALKDGFTAAELEDARRSLLSLRRQGRAQDGNLAGALRANLYLDRRFAFQQQVDEAIASATLEQVNAAWRRWIDPSRLVMAWGGDFKQP